MFHRQKSHFRFVRFLIKVVLSVFYLILHMFLLIVDFLFKLLFQTLNSCFVLVCMHVLIYMCEIT